MNWLLLMLLWLSFAMSQSRALIKLRDKSISYFLGTRAANSHAFCMNLTYLLSPNVNPSLTLIVATCTLLNRSSVHAITIQYNYMTCDIRKG